MGGGTGNKGGYKVGNNEDAEGMCTSVASLEPDPRYSGCCANIFRRGRVVRDLVVGSLVVLGVAVIIAVVFVVCFFFIPDKSVAKTPQLGEEGAFHGAPIKGEGPYGINEVEFNNSTRYEVDPQLEKTKKGGKDPHVDNHEKHQSHNHSHDHEGHAHEGHKEHHHVGPVPETESKPEPESEPEPEPTAEPEPEPEVEATAEPEPESNHTHGNGPVSHDHTHPDIDHNHTHPAKDHDHIHPVVDHEHTHEKGQVTHDHTHPESDHDHTHPEHTLEKGPATHNPTHPEMDHNHTHPESNHDHTHPPTDHEHTHELGPVTHDHSHPEMDHDHTHPAMDHDHTHPAMDHTHTHPEVGHDHTHEQGQVAHDDTHPAMGHDPTHPAMDHDRTHPAMDHTHTHPEMGHDHTHEQGPVAHDPTHPTVEHDHTHPAMDHDHIHPADSTTKATGTEMQNIPGISESEVILVPTPDSTKEREEGSLPPLFKPFSTKSPAEEQGHEGSEGTLKELVVPQDHFTEKTHQVAEGHPEATDGVTVAGTQEAPLGECQPRQLEMCSGLPHALTAFPNWAGDQTEEDLHQTSLPFLRDVIVRSRCSPRAKEYSCAILEPPCTQEGTILPPCRTFCKSVASTCQEFITSRFSLSSAFDCEKFPDSSDPNVCFDMTSGSAPADNTTTMTPTTDEAEGTEAALPETTTLLLEDETITAVQCPELQCLDGTCISLSQVNDGVVDCPEGIDEEDWVTSLI